jgi:hypothetical protein
MSTPEEIQKAAQRQATAGSPKDKERYMASLYIPHRNLMRVINEARTLMTAGAGLSVTLVVGPTGVGKTTFGRMQLRKLLHSYRIQIQEDPSLIPAVMCEVDAAGKGAETNFVLLYSRICSALLAPSALDGFCFPKEPNTPVELLRNSQLMMEAAIRARRLEHLILDEVLHFAHSTTEPIHIGNMIKSFSNRSRFNVLMLGAYGCEALVVASEQLARRISVIHYERYKDSHEDFVEYATFAKSVLVALPYHFEVDIENRLEYLFEGTFGLTGVTVDVLSHAAKRCAEEKRPRWNDAFLQKAMPSKAAQRKIVRSTLRGERDVEPYLEMREGDVYLSEADALKELRVEEVENKRLNQKKGHK